MTAGLIRLLSYQCLILGGISGACALIGYLLTWDGPWLAVAASAGCFTLALSFSKLEARHEKDLEKYD